MDGTGDLFDEFLAQYSSEYLVIQLPQDGPQDHVSISKTIEKKLPSEDFVLLAESFSGGIVPELLELENRHIKGVILVASFLNCPNRLLLPIARLMPIKFLSKMPFSKFAYRYLFLGSKAPSTLVEKFNEVIRAIPESLLKRRLSVMLHQYSPTQTYDLPILYIKATNDRLVSSQQSIEVAEIFKNMVVKEIDGPHFILQAQPKETAILIKNFVSTVS